MNRYYAVSCAIVALLVGLTGVVVFAGAFIINPGFENKDQINTTEPDLEPWTLTNKSGDKILCTSVEKPIPAYEGDCAFKFKGGEGENAKLTQVVDFGVRGIAQRAAGDRYVCYGLRAYSKSAATRLRLKVTVTVVGDPVLRTEKYKQNGKTQSDHDPDPEWVDVGCTIANPVDGVLLTLGELVHSVKLTVTNKSTSGAVYVDGAYSFILDPPPARSQVGAS